MDSVDYEYRWQIEAHDALGVMLKHGQKHRMPSLHWTIASTGSITGKAVGLGATPAEQRAAVVAWAKYLRAEVTERVHQDGTVHLWASFKRGTDDRVGGAIIADIFPELDGGA